MVATPPQHSPQEHTPGTHAQADRTALHLFLSLILCGLLTLPLIQWVANPIQVEPIHGIAIPPLPHRPSFPRVMSGQFQRQVDQFAARGTGLWPALVRVANQVTLSLFHQIGTSKNSSVLVGTGTTLFQPMYLRSFNRSKTIDKKLAHAAVQKLEKLRRQLKKRGIPLVLLISPNAIALYPEIVPPSLTDPTRLERPNSYEVALPLMKKTRLPIVDMFAFFRDARDNLPFRIFPRTGSHWNDLASCIATRAVLDQLTSLGTQWPTVSCEQHSWHIPPPQEDTDLLAIANVLFPQRYQEPGVTVSHAAPAAPPSRRILLVGTSFLFAIQSHFERSGTVQEAGLYFYAKSFRRHTQEQLRPLPLTRVPWNDIWTYDAIILEINQASLTGAGHGFVSAALNALQQG